MLKYFLSGLAFFAVIAGGAELTRLDSFDFRASKPGLTPVGQNGFDLASSATVAADVKYSGSAQQILALRVKGANSGIRAVIHCSGAGGSHTVQSPPVQLNGSEFKEIEWKLNTDFGLGDATYSFTRIEFIVTGSLQLRDLRLAAADSLNLSGNAAPLVVAPIPRPEAPAGAISPVKLFFELDNNDLDSTVKRFTSGSYPCTDTLQRNAGFRNLLLEHAEGLFVMTDTPAAADVIVYSRAAPGKNAEAIRRAVAAGKRLLVFGDPADRERLAELLPLRVTPARYTGFPERLPVVYPVRSELFQGTVLKDAGYAKFFQTSLAAGEVLAELGDGSPWVAERGGVLQFATGLGVEFVESPVYYSTTFLRAAGLARPDILAELERREKELLLRENRRKEKRIQSVAAAAGVSPRGYRLGEMSDGFGRFGWYLDAVAMGNAIRRDLSVSIGNKQGYALQFQKKRILPLPEWSRRVVEGDIRFLGKTASALLQPWSGVGAVEYSAEVDIPRDWADSEITFEVGFIDDLDQLFVNGVKAGETGQDTPGYWEAPRCYRIPPGALRFGEKNHLTLRVANLRGNAGVGGIPSLNSGSSRGPLEVTVPSVDRAGKEYRISADGVGYGMRFSLLSPFIRYTLPGDRMAIQFDQTLGYAAWLDGQGKYRAVPLEAAKPDLYDRKRDGQWRAPWLLLFRPGAAKPLLLVFESQPESLRLEALAGDGSGVLEIGGKGAIGALCIGSPWSDYALPDCTGWEKELPQAESARIEQYLPMAQNYPVGCAEIFKIDRDAGKIDVILQFQYRKFKGDWAKRTREFVLLPPQIAFMTDEKLLAASREKLTDFRFPTVLGPTYGKLGGSTLRYELDLPPPSNVVPVGVTDPLNEFQNRRFARGVVQNCHWSKIEQWTPAAPWGKPDLPNIDLHAWNFGLTSALQGAFFLNPENQEKLKARTAKRLLEPVELYAYKAAARHREEPFSGLKYPALFNSTYPNPTPYAEGFGSKVNYGDCNETVTMVMWNAEFAANQLGQSGMVAPNWNYYRTIMRYQLYGNDLWVHSGNHRENGTGAFLDMINGEYPGAVLYAQLAELAGDGETAEFGWYLAAKKAVPTVSRFYFPRYFETINPVMRGAKNYQICGYSLTWPMHMNYPNSNHNFLNADDVFDCSQGMHGSLISLYWKYAMPKLQEHFRYRVIPSLTGQPKKLYSYAYLAPLGFFDRSTFNLPLYADEVMTNAAGLHSQEAKQGCWTWLRNPFELGAVLWRQNGRIALEECRLLNITQAQYHPEKKLLHLELHSKPDSLLVFSCEKPPQRATVNGQPIPLCKTPNGWQLPLSPGRNLAEICW